MAHPLLVPLSIPDLRGAGVSEPFAFGQADRVRFRELDVLDHVNNAVYLGWFETLRIAYMRAYGISGQRPGAPRPALVLRSVAVEYRAPMFLEEVYVVAGRTRAYRTTSFTMEYSVHSGGSLRAVSEAVIVLMEPDLSARCPLPETWTRAFAKRDGAVSEG